MSDTEIIQTPLGHLICSDNCYSFESGIYSLKFCLDLKKCGMLNAIALQLDQELQYLLDQAWNSKEPLSPVCEGDKLLFEENGESYMNLRKDMGALFLIVSYGIRHNIPFRAIDDSFLFGEEKILNIVSQLTQLHDLFGYVAYVCIKKQAAAIRKYFSSQIH
ncbi:hypothetical protein JW710_04865 [Candidatus Dojkabacteria bacterium]|nr:hypothetical protein [Candidatus Dojkabacteria bacterium]